MRSLMLGMLCGLFFGCSESSPPATGTRSTADQPTTVTTNRPITPDHPAAAAEPADRANTGVNVRDRSSTATTPFDQNENKADVDITAAIRKQVIATKMSSNGHNVKIITQDGKVTLRGPVKTDQEKQQIEDIALAEAGTGNVDSQLEVNHD